MAGHTRRAAMNAIEAHVNNWRTAALEAARVAYVSEYGPWPAGHEDKDGNFYPEDGPSISEMSQDDPSDIQFVEGLIYRRLTLFSGPVRPLQYVGGNSGGEPEHSASLEWSVLCPPAHLDKLQDTFDDGLKDLNTVLQPLTETGLTDPETGESAAISFTLTGADFQAHDIGNYYLRACIIDLSFTLFANSILA